MYRQEINFFKFLIGLFNFGYSLPGGKYGIISLIMVALAGGEGEQVGRGEQLSQT